MRRGVLLLLAALAAAAPSAAQRGKDEECTVCGHDPERMTAGGVVNHGPFPFLRTDSEEVQAFVGTDELLWIETEHFRIGAELEKWKIPVRDRKAYEAELTRFAETWPSVDPEKTKSLDPWLRLHLMAWRMENLYDHAQELWGCREEDFRALPAEQVFLDAKDNDWNADLVAAFNERPKRPEDWPLWIGLGRYLGMPMKLEALILRDEDDMGRLKLKYIGHDNSHPQRWHVTWRVDGSDPVSRTMWFGFSTEAEDMRHDQHVHNALRHNVGINLLDGYMLYLVEAPVWLRAGWGHYLTQRNSPDYNFYDMDEGSGKQQRDEDDWKPAVHRLVSRGEAPGFVDLARLRNFGDLTLEGHLASWSKLCWLMERDPQAFGRWLLMLRTAPGLTNNLSVQRDALREAYGLGFPQAEEAWKQWVLETYPAK